MRIPLLTQDDRFALGGRLTENETHVEIGRKLTNGCIWAYQQFPSRIMPETSNVIPCENQDSCEWDVQRWHQAVLDEATAAGKHENATAEEIIKSEHLPRGFASTPDRRYQLRPEAIESVFILYRITGDPELEEIAWAMFRSIYAFTRTDIANAAISDVTRSPFPQEDSMESFW